MSETSNPVKALNFLQTEVSSVVDHGNPEETSIFRNLLSHLLTPPLSSSSVALFPTVERRLHKRKSSESQTPSSTSDDDWTNVLNEGEIVDDPAALTVPAFTEPYSAVVPTPKNILSADALRSASDPLESSGDADGVEEILSGERYQQRMEIFDSLLLFVGEQWKAPNGDLVDMVDWDGMN
jgi:muskelin